MTFGNYHQERRGVPKETTIVGLSEGAARPLFAIRDEGIKEKAILSVQKALESKKDPVTGTFTKKLKTGDVKKKATLPSGAVKPTAPFSQSIIILQLCAE